MAVVGAAIGAIAGAIGTAFAAGGFFTTFIGRLLLSVAMSALQRALMPKPREPGIKTKVTQTGGTNPCAFPLLKYATAGTHVCPPMSHGQSGKTPNAYLTYVILLSDVPGATLSRVMVNNQYVPLGVTPHADYGLPATGQLAGAFWIKFYDGSQTVADAMLLAKYGSYPERPWTSDMIGRGCAYAIVTFRYERGLYPGLPRVKFELNGIPLYDPRKDTTVGGSGAHRWADKTTWEATVNAAVGIYNVMRGIGLMDGSTWGGKLPAEDLPLATWFTGMNECDLAVSNGVGMEPQFRAGLEVSVDEEPADVIGELMKACTGQMAEIGGLWKIRVGAPGTPVMALTDADIVITKDSSFRPFPSFNSSYNGAHATYPDPESAWEPKEAQPYYVPAYEAADGGQRLIADLNLVAVPYPAQARRLMHAGVEEERRFRRHDMTLPPDYVLLEPLDSLAWTSTENSYSAKAFEISGLTEDPMTLHQHVMMRERDAADFSYPSLPAPAPISILPVIPPAQTVPSFGVTGTSILDSTGAARRPALQLTWEPDLSDVTGIMWEVRLQATGVLVASGSTQNVAAGSLILAEGLIAATAYEVQAKPVCDRPAAWTSPVVVTTPATLLTAPDIAPGTLRDQFQGFVVGPLSRDDTVPGQILFTVTMGAIPKGQIWRRGFHAGMRTGGYAGSDAIIKLEMRKNEYAQGFGGWSDVTTFTRAANQSPWDMISDGGGVQGHYTNIEYRAVVVQEPSGMPTGTGEPWLRDVYLTFERVNN